MPKFLMYLRVWGGIERVGHRQSDRRKYTAVFGRATEYAAGNYTAGRDGSGGVCPGPTVSGNALLGLYGGVYSQFGNRDCGNAETGGYHQYHQSHDPAGGKTLRVCRGYETVLRPVCGSGESDGILEPHEFGKSAENHVCAGADAVSVSELSQ